MKRAHTLAIDVGTHATRALLFDRRGRKLATASRPLTIRHPAPGRAEQDAGEILAATRAAIAEALGEADALPDCAGLAVQRSSVAFWDRVTGEVLAPVVGWQDVRGAGLLESMTPMEPEIARRTGLRLSPHYGASKLAWALSELRAVARARREERLAMGPLAAWLLAGLCDGREPEVDHANASRSLLWNLDERDWDSELLAAFGLPVEALPASRPIRHDYGPLAESGIPLTAVNGDQNAALFAGGPLSAGRAHVNLGTGAFVLLPTGAEAPRHASLLCGIADSDVTSASYLLEGTVNGAGAALSWAEENWDLSPLAPRLDELLSAAPASAAPPTSVEAETPAIFLNAVGGLGSPWWRHDATSRLFAPESLLAGGKPRDAAAAERVARAVAESVLFLVQANLDLLREADTPPGELLVSGGLARSAELCRRLAALGGLPLCRPAESEATARGVAWLAASRPESWEDAGCDLFEPRVDTDLVGRYREWLAAMRAECENA